MNLVIVESPAKAGKIQGFLGDGYIVKSSFGHIRDLQDKSLSIDISNGFLPEYVVPADKKKVVADLKKLADKADKVLLASDEDREGEAISWHLMETLQLDPAKTQRIVFHEITKNAILEAVKNPRQVEMNLVNAQQARRVLDRLVGFELSPVLWRKVQRGLSAGRVQSVALRLVTDREKEILAFKPESYYHVAAQFSCEGFKMNGSLESRLGSLEEAQQFLSDSIGAKYHVVNIDKKEGVRVPAAPFTTSTLQQEAARKLRFPVGTTMRVAQSLYEKGLITYMRTDSTNLSTLALGTAKKYIIENFGEEYSHPRQFKTKSKGAQEAHEAIRPTYIENVSIEGTAQEQKLYNLIWKRTVASQMADEKVISTSVKIALDKRAETYGVQAVQIVFDGFQKVYIEGVDDVQDNEQEAVIPALAVGQAVDALSVSAECKFTQAPYRYSEATLVKRLEELGIGRPSTYAPTISTLTTARGYLVKGDKEGQKKAVTNLTLKGSQITSTVKEETVGAEKGKLIPAEIGMIVSDYLVGSFSDILDYNFTAEVEESFDKIAEGEKVWNEVISDFYGPFHGNVEKVIATKDYARVNRVIGVDPQTGLEITAKFGQFGAYVQRGEGENRQIASLEKGQLIENITLEDALKLLCLPRTVGQYEGVDIVATKGRFGPYLKYGNKNISLPKGAVAETISLEACIELIKAPAMQQAAGPIKNFQDGALQVLDGRFGPYIKYEGKNYKLPRSVKPDELTEEQCISIVKKSKK